MAQGREFDAQSVLDFSIKLARDAGRIITKGRESLREDIAQNFDSIIKKNTSDLVTKTDQDTEDFVRAQIKQHYGDDARLIGEESYAAGDEAKIEGDDRLVFITDPIDGTTNFVANFPFFCISIAVWHNSQPLVGVVYAPLLDRLYYGRTGAGSFLVTPSSSSPRQLPLQKPLPLTELKHALIALEWGSDRSAETVNRKATTMERLASKDGNMVRGIRSIGSAALSCCFVAEGSLDLYHEVGCWVSVIVDWVAGNHWLVLTPHVTWLLNCLTLI